MSRSHHIAAATRIIAAPMGRFVIMLASDGSLSSGWRQLDGERAGIRAKGNSSWLDGVAERLRDYFAGRCVPDWSDVPTPSGPGFHNRCWDACRRIPHGELRSYGELAEMAGSSRLASRAAGQAMRSNPLSVIVPCHRVVAGDGRLHGYAGTTDRHSDALNIKRGLLSLEQPLAPTAAHC